MGNTKIGLARPLLASLISALGRIGGMTRNRFDYKDECSVSVDVKGVNDGKVRMKRFATGVK